MICADVRLMKERKISLPSSSSLLKVPNYDLRGR